MAQAGVGEGISRAAVAVTLLVLVITILGQPQAVVCAEPSEFKLPGLTLTKCQCLGNEVLKQDGSCVEQPGGTKVVVETGQVSTSSMNVTVEPLECPHYNVTLKQGDVHLRHRGDWVVLRGKWRGLRINHYCLTHYLTTKDFPTWRINACIPPPTIPRCCPQGQAIKGDKCVNSTMELGMFDPPLLAGPGELPSITWPGQSVAVTPPVTCKKGARLLQAMLGRQAERRASVVALPTGLVLVTKRGIAPVEYTFAPDFCIDQGVNHQQGSENASYFANYCDAVRISDLRCNDTDICVRKCCGEGQAMHAHIGACVPTKQSFIAPFMADHPKEVHVLTGLPSCAPIGHVALDKGVDARGRIIQHGKPYNADEYCLDNFIRGNTSAVEVLICITDPPNVGGWTVARQYITPVLLAISAAAVIVLLSLMWLLPELRKDGGQAQASHALAILLATITLLILQIPNNFPPSACIFMAILLHFSFMSIFSWVAVMSLVLWKKVWSIAKSGGGPPIEQTLVQQCVGWGVPLIVIILNVTIHFNVPQDQTGVVHPRIAEGRCWYAGTLEVVLYFYLPILVLVVTSAVATGMTLWHYCTMSRETIKMSGLGEEQPDANSNTTKHESDTQEIINSFNYTYEIRQHSILVGVAIFFWITEGLSMKIEPVDIWSLADIINSLYGLNVLLIFVLNPNKRKHIHLYNLKSSFMIKAKKITKIRELCMKCRK